MKAVLLFAASALAWTAAGEDILRFALDFSRGHSAVTSVGQASPASGNASIENGALLVKHGYACGISGSEAPFNPLIYLTKDNLPESPRGEISAEFRYRRLPGRENYISPIWAIRRVKHTKVTGFCRMQIKFAPGAPSVEYDEFNLNSTQGKTLKISIPLRREALGGNCRVTLKIDGRKRTVEVDGLPPRTVATPWETGEFLPGATALAVGGAYENSGKLVDPEVELLIRRLTIREFDIEGGNRR